MKTNWFQVARPHFVRAAIAALVAIAGLVLASQTDIDRLKELRRLKVLEVGDWLPFVIGALLLLVGGIIAVRAVARGVRKASGEQLGDARGAGLSMLVTIIGYLLVAITVLSTVGVNPAGLLLGGAMAGIVLGIAAQQTLSNFFAGIVLLVNRPLAVGEYVVLRSGPLSGVYEGLVTDMSLFYVKLQTANGPVALPNAGVLAAAIGPGSKPIEEDKNGEEEPEEDKHEEHQAPPSSGGPPS
jgi:small-conductance mechanosensitive channel